MQAFDRLFLPKDTKQALGSRLAEVNTSLLLDKYPYLPRPGEKAHAARDPFLDLICGTAFSATGQANALAAGRVPGAETFHVQLDGRLLIDQAGSLLENAGLSLHRTFGVPMISGTAVKGVARAQAIRELADAAEDQRDLLLLRILLVFGYGQSDLAQNRKGEAPDVLEAYCAGGRALTKLPLPEGLKHVKAFAGTVAFLPALPVDRVKIDRDIVTAHHRNYYSKPDVVLPRDNESPNPYPFPAIAPAEGTQAAFRFSLLRLRRWNAVKPRVQEWLGGDFDPLSAAREWLLEALVNYGIGAKTAAGYGAMVFDRNVDEARRAAQREAAAQEQERRAAEAQEKERIASLAPEQQAAEAYRDRQTGDVAGYIKGRMAAIESLPEQEQRSICVLLRDYAPFQSIWRKDAQEAAKAEKQNEKKRAKNKSYARVRAVSATAERLGITLS